MSIACIDAFTQQCQLTSGPTDLSGGAHDPGNLWPCMAAIFFLTSFNRPRGRGMAPLAPLDPLVVLRLNGSVQSYFDGKITILRGF